MQDRYAGDIGDFVKIGLLRWLVAATGGEQPLHLGVVWYLVPDESHNADGKHVAYLDPAHHGLERFGGLDPDLYERLADVVRSGERSVSSLERSGALPAGTRTFSRPLSLDHFSIANRVGRLEHRRSWIVDALDATAACDVVFVDPDNGLRSTHHAVGRHRDKSVKHAYLDELAMFTARGQSLVIYHHADRSAPVIEQASRRMMEVTAELGIEPMAAVQASAGTVRLFLVVPAAAHVERLRARLSALALSPWSRELRVHWSNPTGGS